MVREISYKELPTCVEIRKLIFDNNLDLSFPMDAVDGSTVTDWNVHNKVADMCDSDLIKFIELIKSKYSDKYVTKPSGYSSSIDIYKLL